MIRPPPPWNMSPVVPSIVPIFASRMLALQEAMPTLSIILLVVLPAVLVPTPKGIHTLGSLLSLHMAPRTLQTSPLTWMDLIATPTSLRVSPIILKMVAFPPTITLLGSRTLRSAISPTMSLPATPRLFDITVLTAPFPPLGLLFEKKCFIASLGLLPPGALPPGWVPVASCPTVVVVPRSLVSRPRSNRLRKVTILGLLWHTVFECLWHILLAKPLHLGCLLAPTTLLRAKLSRRRVSSEAPMSLLLLWPLFPLASVSAMVSIISMKTFRDVNRTTPAPAVPLTAPSPPRPPPHLDNSSHKSAKEKLCYASWKPWCGLYDSFPCFDKKFQSSF